MVHNYGYRSYGRSMLTTAFVSAMLAWVIAVTGLPPAPAPEVRVVSADPYDGQRLVNINGREPGALAFTYPTAIYVSPSLAAAIGTPLADCILAHELVHWLQFKSGKTYNCTPEMERLAYAVEELCMAQRGVDFWSVSGWKPTQLARLMECGR